MVPVTVQIGLGLEGNVIGEAKYNWQDNTISGTIGLDLFATLTAFGGIGVSKLVGGGAYGSASLKGRYNFLGTEQGLQYIDLTGVFGVKVYVGWLSYQKAFAHDTWNIYTAIKGNSRSIQLSNGHNKAILDSDIYAINNYTMDDISYLVKESDWLGSSTSLMRSNKGEAKTEFNPLLTDTYRNAQPNVLLTAVI